MIFRQVKNLKKADMVNINLHENTEKHWIVVDIANDPAGITLKLNQIVEGRTLQVTLFQDDLIEIVFA